MFSFFGVLRRASSEAQCQLVRVTRADLEATVAARAFTGIDGGAGGHRFEIDDLLFGTDDDAVSAVVATPRIEADSQRRATPDQSVESPERTQRAAPAVLQHVEVEQHKPGDHEKAQTGPEDQLAVDHPDRAQPLERSDTGNRRDHQRERQHAVARVTGDIELPGDPKAAPQPCGEVAERIDGANPCTEATPAGQEVAGQHDRGSE